MRDFTLTESTCDQAALVYARSKGWDEWFSNPTAGPLKASDPCLRQTTSERGWLIPSFADRDDERSLP